MHVVTLLTNPETPVLDRVTVESLRNAWGGGAARWLDPGVPPAGVADLLAPSALAGWAALDAPRWVNNARVEHDAAPS